MRKLLLIAFTALAMTTPVLAAPWVRGYAVDGYEPSFYYGAKVGSIEPGSDCPRGAIAEMDYKKILKTRWRSDAEVEELTRPVAPGRDPFNVMAEAIAHRGYARHIDTYINPFTAPDPGMQEVTGKIAEGFNLDGNARTGGFTSPAGEKGIDNNLYRALGCEMSYRDPPYRSYMGTRVVDKMADGLFTIVIRVSGTQDPRNDTDAMVEVAYSPDHLIKAADGRIVSDYSFRVAKDAQYTRLKARIKNGVVETEPVAELRMPEFAWYDTNNGEAIFYKGRIRFTMHADGTADGLFGGYRDWRTLYGRETFNEPTAGGESREYSYFQNQIGMYYALKRNADGIPDHRTGRNIGISAAYRFSARPAYVVDPALPVTVNEVAPDDAAIKRALFLKGVTTATPSPEPQRKRRPVSPPAAPPVPAVEARSDTPAALASATSSSKR